MIKLCVQEGEADGMDIRFTQNIYPSAAGGDAKISYYVLFPVGAELRGIVQISHGMCGILHTLYGICKISLLSRIYCLRQ